MPSKRNGRALVAVSASALLAASVWACGGSGSKPAVSAAASTTPGIQGPASGSATPPPITGNRDRAQQLLAAGDYAAAAQAYRLIAQASGGSARHEALLGLAIAASASGDLDTAVQALRDRLAAGLGDAAEQARTRFLLGRVLNDSGQFEEARAELEAAAGADLGPLKPFVLVEWQRAAVGGGDLALAAQVGARIGSAQGVPTGLVEGVQRRNVVAARGSGDPAELATALEGLVEVSGLARDRLELADVYEKLGREADRAAVLFDTIEETPADPQAATALDLLEADGYAVDAVDAGYVYYRARRYEDAKRALTAALTATPALESDRRLFAMYYLAAATEDGGDAAAAVPLYDAVVAMAPGSSLAHRARYWAARSTEEDGDFQSASTRYVALTNAKPPGEFSAEAAFRAGFLLYARGEAVAAAAAWDAVGERTPRVLFWRGAALAAAGQAQLARASFEQAIAAGPLDFYGLEAARALSGEPLDVGYRQRDLDRPVDWTALEAWLAKRAGGAPSPAPAAAAAGLVALGLRDEASAVLLEAAPPGSSPWAMLAAARQARELGLGGTAARLAERLRASTGVSWQEAPVELLALAYPVDFPAALDREAREAGLDPLFVAALVRIESLWDPAAVSPVGAIGLTQVMPATGEAIAAALRVDGFTPASLLEPAVSLRFGSYYIAEQVRSYGEPFVALAAYNGGPGRAGRWMDRWDGANAPSFVEVVDIEETRDYVERVLEAYGRYLHAYGDDPGRR